ncbi:hypothetical protein ZHAS_00014590 [Anopheles sinensis]|uniref:Ig-like domain-containing protein n=1 Tax=Anopheles sinensis TaxID=74873 RepID=A0A084W8J3_ANOSI|nr:hypothetical protein ZHAS_00014590 [Anopheles sinensis]
MHQNENLKKHFELPETYILTEAGEKLEIKCAAPKGYPKPQITWLKNNSTITSSPLLKFTTEGNIVITSVNERCPEFPLESINIQYYLL